MATAKDILSDITLEVDGDLPSPNQLAEAMTAFSALLNSAHRKCNEKSAVRWGMQVSKGSNLLGYIPQSPFNPQAISIIENGLLALENGAESPPNFDESMLNNLLTITELVKKRKGQETSVRLWFHKHPYNIGNAIKSNLNIAMEGSFYEYGSIEGRLEILDSHNGMDFSIYEPLYSKRISCVAAAKEVFERAYQLYEQRVEAEGMIKYTAKGIPFEIKVERIHSLVPEQGIPNYQSTRGILKDYV